MEKFSFVFRRMRRISNCEILFSIHTHCVCMERLFSFRKILFFVVSVCLFSSILPERYWHCGRTNVWKQNDNKSGQNCRLKGKIAEFRGEFDGFRRNLSISVRFGVKTKEFWWLRGQFWWFLLYFEKFMEIRGQTIKFRWFWFDSDDLCWILSF